MQIVEDNIQKNRDKIIIYTSLVGIITNIFLVAFKMFVGILSNSIAVILDAVNNLSDALSSIITIIGTKLANKKPDKKHPLGHGRVEYLTAMIVAGIVLYAGITSIVESVKKIIYPEEANYSLNGLIIIAVAVVVKIVLGRFVRKQGKKVNSGALIASGSDAMFDALLSFSVLISAVIFVKFKISLEAYVGFIISLFIIKSGVEMLQDTLSDILGQRADKALTLKIKDVIRSIPNVRGAYDLFVYNYGPDKNYASVHVEVPDTMTIDEFDVLTRQVEKKVYKETGVILTGIGAYSYNTQNNESTKIRDIVHKVVFAHDFAIQMHGFYIDTKTKNIRFDVVMSFDIEATEGIQLLKDDLNKVLPEYSFLIVADVDVSD